MPGVPRRSMPSTSSSSSLSVSDALTNLSKAATVALNAVQGAHDHVYLEVERARAERDDALKALHDAQLDAKDLEGREEGWKAALDKSDLTIKHQAETITQLRSEIQTWKTQLTHLEESSRQEIDGWKEQYRRAERERSRLSARIEELIAGQLAWNAAAHAYTAPYTPHIGYAEIPEPSTSSGITTKRASTSHSRRAPGTPRANGHILVDDDDDVPLTSISARKQKPHPARNTTQAEGRFRPPASPSRASTARRRENATPADVPQASGGRATPRTSAGTRSAPTQTSMPPQSRLIRRVTAVVDVKEEEEDGEGLDDLDSAASGSMYDPDEYPPVAAGSRKRRGSNASGRSRPTRRDFDDDDQSADEEGGAHSERGGDAEDDELLLGPKTQQTRKPPRTPSQGQSGGTKTPRTGGGARQAGSTKKRKLVDGDAGAAGGRPGSVKVAKSR